MCTLTPTFNNPIALIRSCIFLLKSVMQGVCRWLMQVPLLFNSEINGKRGRNLKNVHNIQHPLVQYSHLGVQAGTE